MCGGFHACGDVPGEQFIDAVDRVIRNACEHVPQVTFRIKSIQFCRSDQTVNGCSPFASGIRTRKKKILSA